MRVGGEGRKKILIVGEAPGRQEDEKGTQFVGVSGQRLKEALEECGISMRRDCWTTNALICRPPGNKIKDKNAIAYCRPNLLRSIRELNPVITILLGGLAVRSLIVESWGKEEIGEVNRWVGWRIPCQKFNTWICPTWHPSYVIRTEEETRKPFSFFDKHIKRALEFDSHPWPDGAPDWSGKVRTIFDTREAAQIVDQWCDLGGTFAFDYENTCLKPEYVGGEIVCAALCREGKETIAFPWHGDVVDACRRILRSKKCAFIASNMKHEDRWTRWAFGKPVRNWAWDTMIAAHALDNREKITGLKFQAFVNFGMPSYNEHIEEFLKTTGDTKINRVKQIELSQLLKYCGLDALLEYKLAVVQCRQLARMNLS